MENTNSKKIKKYHKKARNSLILGTAGSIVVGLGVMTTYIPKKPSPVVSEYKNMQESLSQLQELKKEYYMPELPYSNEKINSHLEKAFETENKKTKNLENAIEEIQRDMSQKRENPKIKEYISKKENRCSSPTSILILGSIAVPGFVGLGISEYYYKKARKLENQENN